MASTKRGGLTCGMEAGLGQEGNHVGGSIRHGAGPKQGKEGVHEEEQPGGQFQSPRRIRKAFAQRRRLQQRREIGY